MELSAEPEQAVAAVAAVRTELARVCTAVGLAAPSDDDVVIRHHRGGLAIAVRAPIDTLLALAEAAEWAAESAVAITDGGAPFELEPRATQLREMVAAQTCLKLLGIEAEAARRGLPLLWDDDVVTVGSGARAQSWPRDAVPAPDEVPWDSLRRVPVALITGTNGKTTSARLVARMVRQGGRAAGATSTDGVTVDETFVERGDCTGPFAARTALRRPDIEVAVLETARGGILRRGLATDVADVALITNVSDDHLGTYGIDDVPAMADVKAVVAHVVGPTGHVVLNLSDPELMRLAPTFGARTLFFTMDAARAEAHHAATGADVWTHDHGWLIRLSGGARTVLVAAADVPITFGGAAAFNIENALAASATASALGVSDEAIVRALRSFEPSAADNPGRANHAEVHGVHVLMDFGHNAEAIRAVLGLATALRGANRLFVSVGHPGDRTDDALRGLARAVHSADPSRIYLRELTGYLRGRALGEVPALVTAEYQRLGVADGVVVSVQTELEALQHALHAASPGDVVVMLTHLDRDGARAFLAQRAAPAAEPAA